MRRARYASEVAGCGAAALLALALSGCGTVSKPGVTPAAGGNARTPPRSAPVLPAAGSGRGGYYKDDGPGDNPPPGLAELPDAEARIETPLPRANRSYVVFGKTYTPITGDQPFTQRGIGSWYGKKFHGQRTSSGELYDMYKMTAAHPTLPIPSYARLTSMGNGKQVIVRINDRGPFHASRVIDVSYTAALKLGLLDKGSHELQIERLLPAEIERMRNAAKQAPAQAAAQAVDKPADKPAAKPIMFVVPNTPLTSHDMTTLSMSGLEPQTGNVDVPQTTLLSPVGAVQTGDASQNGFYVQLGAFSQADNAQAARARLEQFAARLGKLEVVEADAVHRLFGGPFASRQEAIQAIEALPDALSLKPIVVQR